MNILHYLLGKRPKEKQEEPKQTSFNFSMEEVVCLGDRYEYTVVANSKEEALQKLVIYFFGKDKPYEISQAVSTRVRGISYPGRSRFRYSGMPKWFAKRISGYVGDKDTEENYQHSLEVYCKENNIELHRNQ